MTIFLFILGIVLFIGLVVAHEWGHFIMARRGGVEVEEFGIFFPPRLFKKRTKGGWDFTINLLPLGGFVKLKGEHDSDTGKGTFGAASLKTKSKITAAGVVVNLAIAYLLFLLLAFIGLPKLVPDQFTVASDTKYVHQASYSVKADTIEKGSPAAQAGIKPDDTVLALGPAGHLTKVLQPQQLTDLTDKYAGQTVELKYEHNGKTVEKTVALRSDAAVAALTKQSKPAGHLGLSVYPTQAGLTV
ncbi:MAG TPA: site-2 protease family protein, partial [Candidatus Saccharimonadales bacterium]|nr:site-2 protease family protein [Candidatus Saccharimonadales bacterium]